MQEKSGKIFYTIRAKIELVCQLLLIVNCSDGLRSLKSIVILPQFVPDFHHALMLFRSSGIGLIIAPFVINTIADGLELTYRKVFPADLLAPLCHSCRMSVPRYGTKPYCPAPGFTPDFVSYLLISAEYPVDNMT